MSKTSETSAALMTSVQQGQIKYALPEYFYKERIRYQAFITQCDVYITVHNQELNTAYKRILFMRSYLREVALNWFMQDYISNSRED